MHIYVTAIAFLVQCYLSLYAPILLGGNNVGILHPKRNEMEKTLHPIKNNM